MEATFAMLSNQDAASTIFAIINNFIQSTEKHRRHPELENFPRIFESIPWRRLYKKLLEAETVTYQGMERWDANELPFGGTGIFWCFTELQRSGENVSRKTEDGQNWSGKTGRLPKKGYPDQILVAKLVNGKEFHMLELTLKQEKPTVALCKLWRKQGNSTGASTPQQAVEDHFVIPDEETKMQIDQLQGQLEGITQQHVLDQVLSESWYMLLQDSTSDLFQLTGQDDYSIYQNSISFLHNTIESFVQVALFNGEEAHKMASAAQNLASYFRNVLNFLEISGEPESNRPSTSNSAQLMEAAGVGRTVDPAALAPEPETATQDDLLDPELAQLLSMEDSYFDVGEYYRNNSDGGNGAI